MTTLTKAKINRELKGQALIREMAIRIRECEDIRLRIKTEWTTASVQDMEWLSGRLFEAEDRIRRIKRSKYYLEVTT